MTTAREQRLVGLAHHDALVDVVAQLDLAPPTTGGCTRRPAWFVSVHTDVPLLPGQAAAVSQRAAEAVVRGAEAHREVATSAPVVVVRGADDADAPGRFEAGAVVHWCALAPLFDVVEDAAGAATVEVLRRVGPQRLAELRRLQS